MDIIFWNHQHLFNATFNEPHFAFFWCNATTTLRIDLQPSFPNFRITLGRDHYFKAQWSEHRTKGSPQRVRFVNASTGTRMLDIHSPKSCVPKIGKRDQCPGVRVAEKFGQSVFYGVSFAFLVIHNGDSRRWSKCVYRNERVSLIWRIFVFVSALVG